MNSSELLSSFLSKKIENSEQEIFKKEAYDYRSNLNIILFGATGVGKSSLVNAISGEDIVKSGVGEPITQFLEKIEIKSRGLTLWDTKGIEAKDYENTKELLIKDIEDGFQKAFDSNDDDEAPHVVWLCVKESSKRIEGREHDLISIAKKFGIPTIIVFTNTQFEDGDNFFKEAKEYINKQHEIFINNRYVRVNSVAYPFRNETIPVCGLKELLELTEDCFSDAKDNVQKCIEALRMAQEVNMQIKLDAMIESAKAKVTTAAITAATASAIPLPGSKIALVTAVQSRLFYTINSDFEVNDHHSQVLAIITGVIKLVINARIGKTGLYTSLKFIPGIGTIIGGGLAASSSRSLTEAAGYAYIQLLEKYYERNTGKTILPQQTSVALAFFKERLEYELIKKNHQKLYKS